MDIEPPPPKQISARLRARFGFIFGGFPCGFLAEFRREPLGRTSCVPHSGFFKTDLFYLGVSLRLRSNLFYQKFVSCESLILVCYLHSATTQPPLQNTLEGVFLRFCCVVPSLATPGPYRKKKIKITAKQKKHGQGVGEGTVRHSRSGTARLLACCGADAVAWRNGDSSPKLN